MRWVEATDRSRALALYWAATAACVALTIPWAGRLSPALPACPMKAWTGWPCPTCGSTRAVISLARGEPLAALSVNPGFTLALAGFVVVGLAAPVWVRITGRAPDATSLSRPARAAIFVGIGLNWLWLVLRGV